MAAGGQYNRAGDLRSASLSGERDLTFREVASAPIRADIGHRDRSPLHRQRRPGAVGHGRGDAARRTDAGVADVPGRAIDRLGDGGERGHHPRAVFPDTRLRARSFVRGPPAAGGRRHAGDLSGAGPVHPRHALAARHDPPCALQAGDRRRGRRRARRGRPGAGHGLVRHDDQGLQAPPRGRARLRPGRKDGPARQARTPAGRVRLHDVEQRHVRLRPGHRSDLRVGALRDRHAGRQGAWPVSRQHLAQQLRHRAYLRRHPRVRRRPGRAELLLHQRPFAGRRRRALHRADRPHADAAALGARLSPVPVQLLPGIHGPIRRAELPHPADSGRHALARYPLSRRLQPVHVGPAAISRSGAAHHRPSCARASPRHHRRSASEEGTGLGAVRHGVGRRPLRQERRRLDLRSAGLARPRRAQPGAERVSGFHAPRRAHVVGTPLFTAPRQRRRRHLERHERARRLRHADRDDAARRAVRQRRIAGGASRRAQRLRAADVARHLRRAAAAASGFASVRADARDLRRRAAVCGGLGRRQRQRMGRTCAGRCRC